MIKEKAIIVEVNDDVAWVETQRQTTCSACQVRKGCGTSTLQKVLGQKRTRLKVMNPMGHTVGEEVELGLQESALIKGSLMLYTLPLLFMFGAATMGYLIFLFGGYVYGEGYQILFSLAGLFAGFIWVSICSKKMSRSPEFQAVIL